MFRTLSINVVVTLTILGYVGTPGACADRLSLQKQQSTDSTQLKPHYTRQVSNLSSSLSISLTDTMNDYVLYSAEPVAGTEWGIAVVFSDEQEWKLLGNLIYSPNAESVSYSGVRSFKYEQAALNEAAFLYEAGLIDDYVVYERDKQPTWYFVDNFDTLAEAEEAAAVIESTTNQITMIEPLLVELFTPVWR